VLGPIQRGQVSTLKQVQKREAKFANNINELGWETLAQHRLIARICVLFKAYTGRQAWKTIGNRLLKPCYISREDHNKKIRTRKQRTDVGKYSFINSTIKSCITGGKNYLVRRFKIIFLDVGIHVFPNEGGQKHLVRDTKGQRGSQGKDGYKAEREKESCVR